ncbi:MAG: SAM hydrolase/SAM-dependent halogenase family protein [Frankia sp.]
MPCVGFLTDYGLDDAFVAVCHGVLLRTAPLVRIVDITHLVPPGDVRRGSVVLADAVGYLPPGSVHLAVVDPGVGTARRPVALATPGGALVGPDNGLLAPAADRLGGVTGAVELPVPPGTPATFHGRDVFAPAVGALVSGTRLEALGAAIDPVTLIRLPAPLAEVVTIGPEGRDHGPAPAGGPGGSRSDLTGVRDGLAPGSPGPRPEADGGRALEAEVVSVDHFGNVALAAGPDLLAAAGLRIGGRATVGRPGDEGITVAVGATFGSVPVGEVVLYIDSAGRVALAVNRGNAAERLSLAPGAIVRAAPVPE